MKLTFCPLFSGSGGNAIYVSAGDTRILIDAGMPGRVVENALRSIDVLPETLTAIAITHEHTDHTKGAGILSRKYHIPIYANERTFEAMYKTVGEIPRWDRRYFETGEDFYINDLALLPFPISHDAAEPVGYRIFCGGASVAVATDMGKMTRRVFDALCGTQVMVLESNYDPTLLMQNERYPLHLKQRIRSTLGHLSNEDSAKCLLALHREGLQHVLLGHLSEHNNTPELALSTAVEALQQAGVCVNEDITVDIAWRDRVSRMFILG